MHIRTYSLLICLAFSSVLKAQQKLPDFGKIDPALLQMKQCSFEPEAPAMKIFDVTETSFEWLNYGTKIRTERRVRIKIFREKGYEYSEIRIPYISKKSIAKLKDLDGVVYNLDDKGNVVTRKLKKDDFFKESVVKKKMGLISFTFPDLRPGSVVEFRYTRIEYDRLQPESWLIQGDIPAEYSAYIFTSPVESSLNTKLTGTDAVGKTVNLVKHDLFRETTFFKEKIPSFKSEPFMSSERDNIMKMIFMHFPRGSFMGGLNTNQDFLWKVTGDQLLNSKDFTAEMQTVIPGTQSILDSVKKIRDTVDKIRFLYKKVQQHFAGKAEQTVGFDKLADSWKDADGNTTEINFTLLNLLLKENIRSYPLLISTHEHGKVRKDFPSLSQLNGVDVIAMPDSMHYYVMDASQHYQPMDFPPLNVLNREALVLNPGNVAWLNVADERPLLKEVQTVFADIDSTGLLEAEATVQHINYAKTLLLDTLHTEDEAEKSSKKVLPPEMKIMSVEKTQTDADDDPLYESVKFSYEPQQSDAFYFYNPNFFSVFRQNPFSAKERRSDIDLGCNQEYVITLTLNIPPVFEVETLPKNIIFRTPDSGLYLSRTYQLHDKQIYLSLHLLVSRAEYDVTEYAGVRDFFSRLTGYLNEEIVLRRKK